MSDECGREAYSSLITHHSSLLPMSRKRIAILTGGGDCPGLNAVIRAAVRTCRENGFDVLGVQLGFEGLLTNSVVPLSTESIRGILPNEGTQLHMTHRGNALQNL